MIDYEKLKLAHELALQINNPWIWINTSYSCNANHIQAKLILGLNSSEQDIFCFDEIDDLITKLKELTQPELKYKEGQEVYFISCNGGIGYEEIDDIDKSANEQYFINEERWFREDELYATKYELIEAQCKYWGELLCKENNGKFDGIKCLRDIQPSPCAGNIPREQIKDAISSLCAPSKECEHEYQKTLDISGMNFINMCHKCMDRKAYCEHEDDGNFYLTNPAKYKCSKCGEFYK